MAMVPSCEKCGASQPGNRLPYEVHPCRFSTAVEDFHVTLCMECRQTTTIAEFIALDEEGGRPGGAVKQGPEQMPYLVGYGSTS